jgi:hypothetical protein
MGQTHAVIADEIPLEAVTAKPENSTPCLGLVLRKSIVGHRAMSEKCPSSRAGETALRSVLIHVHHTAVTFHHVILACRSTGRCSTNSRDGKLDFDGSGLLELQARLD